MIGVLNYGLGNINSISNIIKHVGGESRIISKHDDIEGIKKLIIPGVGSFDHGMQGLHDGKWVELLNEMVNSAGRVVPIYSVVVIVSPDAIRGF